MISNELNSLYATLGDLHHSTDLSNIEIQNILCPNELKRTAQMIIYAKSNFELNVLKYRFGSPGTFLRVDSDEYEEFKRWKIRKKRLSVM